MFSELNTRARVKQAYRDRGKGGESWGKTSPRRERRRGYLLAVSQVERNFGSNGSPWHPSQDASFLSVRFSFFT